MGTAEPYSVSAFENDLELSMRNRVRDAREIHNRPRGKVVRLSHIDTVATWVTAHQ